MASRLKWEHQPVPVASAAMDLYLDTKALGLQNNNCYRFDVYLNTLSGPTSIKASALTWAVFKPVK